MIPAARKRTLEEHKKAQGNFGRSRNEYRFICRKLRIPEAREALAAAILDAYVRFSDTPGQTHTWSEANLERRIEKIGKARQIREVRHALIAVGLLERCGEDSRGVLICRADLDKIDREMADWTSGWEDDPAHTPIKAKPRGRSAVVFIDRNKTIQEPNLVKSAVVQEAEVAISQQDTNDPDNPWERVKGQLAGKLGPGAINNWLSATSFASMEEEILTVEVPNETTATWIEQEYGEQIEASLRELSLGVASVHYRVIAPRQMSVTDDAEQTQFRANSAGPSLEEKNTEEQLASQLGKLTQELKPDVQTMRNLNRAFGQLPTSWRGDALERFAQKVRGYGKRKDIGGGILFNDAKEVCADLSREHQPFYYFQFSSLEQALAQMAADEQEARKHPDRAELLWKRPWMPQPIPFPRGTPQFTAEFERLFQTIPRKFMGREESARGRSMGASL